MAETGKPAVVENLSHRFGSLPGGAWPESPEKAVVLPIAKTGQGEPAGFVIVGISPRLALNDDYSGFLDLLAGHVAAAIANARAYEIERQRAETLAELDRAKRHGPCNSYGLGAGRGPPQISRSRIRRTYNETYRAGGFGEAVGEFAGRDWLGLSAA